LRVQRLERVRWNGSLAIALLVHALALYGLILMTRPHQPPPDTGVTEVELTYIETAPAEQESPEEPPEPRPAPPAEPAAAPAPAEPPATPLPVQNNGFAMTAGPMLATAPTRPQGSPAQTARLAPLVITPGFRHDTRLPAYPADARAKAEQGDVLIEVMLDPDGSVRGTRIIESSGHARLDAAALQGARMLRFRPPRPPPGVVLRNAIFVEVPFSFRLE
jgi:protein TonB